MRKAARRAGRQGRTAIDSSYSLLTLRAAGVPLVLCALLSGSFTCPVLSQLPSSNSSRSSTKLNGRVVVNKVSGPESGVELLEKIFTRVMSLPQIAMSKQKLSQEEAQRADAPGVDYTLAIRPKETGKIFSPQTPSIRVLPPTKLTSLVRPGQPDFYGDEEGMPPPTTTLAGGSNSSISNAGGGAPMAPGAGAPPPEDDFNIESWKGGTLQRVAGQQRLRDSQVLKADADRVGVWDKEGNLGNLTTGHAPSEPSSGWGLSSRKDVVLQGGSLPPTNMGKLVRHPGDNLYPTYAAGASATVRASVASRLSKNVAQKPADLSTATATRRAVEKDKAEAKSCDAKDSGRYVIAARQKAEFYAAPRRFQIVDDRPAVNDFRESASASVPTTIQLPPPPNGFASKVAIAQNKTAGGYAPPTVSSKKSAAPLYNAIPAQIISIEDANNLKRQNTQGSISSNRANYLSGQMYNQLAERNSAPMEKRELIALLPPNVATGIPLVSLGTSQLQVSAALSAMGTLKEQKINRWTVMTWKKPESAGGKTSLQLFFRNGLLDAIRIFDPTLVAQDFGVAPGDGLERVKEKFGEPAFLIQEPSQGLGQNYIYPISQVGFQLARADEKSPPKVVSVLIFSVK